MPDSVPGGINASRSAEQSLPGAQIVYAHPPNGSRRQDSSRRAAASPVNEGQRSKAMRTAPWHSPALPLYCPDFSAR